MTKGEYGKGYYGILMTVLKSGAILAQLKIIASSFHKAAIISNKKSLGHDQ